MIQPKDEDKIEKAKINYTYNLSLTAKDKKRLEDLEEKLEVPKSQVLRKALRELYKKEFKKNFSIN